MWTPCLRMHDGRRVEVRFDELGAMYRLRLLGAYGPHDAFLDPSCSAPTRDLTELVEALAGGEPSWLQPTALAPMQAALATLDPQRDTPTWSAWWEFVAAVDAQQADFTSAWLELVGLLRAAHERLRERGVDTRPPGGADALEWRRHDEDDPALRTIVERALAIVIAPLWGERGTTRTVPARLAMASHQDALFRWRRARAASLPLEDLDALVADRWTYLRPLEDGRIALDLDYLLPLLPHLAALAPWADLRAPTGPDVVEGTFVARGRVVELVRDQRRWGVAVDGGEAVRLPAGLGAELASRHERALEGDRPSLAEDALALGDAVGHGLDPRVPFTAGIFGHREVQARWRRGAWQWRALRGTWQESWERAGRVTSWRREVASLVPPGLRGRALPSYLHPVLAPALGRAFEREVGLHPPTPYQDVAWRDVIGHALGGELVHVATNPYRPEWVLATDTPYPIELDGQLWPSVDAAVAGAMAVGGAEAARRALWQALAWKHKTDFVARMTLAATGDALLVVPSRWDGVLGPEPTVVGQALMEIRRRMR